MTEAVLRAAARAIEEGRRAALVIVVAASGSTPQRPGAKMLVYEDGRTLGTIGGGRDEHDAAGQACEAIRDGRPRLVRYALDDDLSAGSGPICGGQMDVYIEPIERAPDLYLIGAGHVSVEVARFAQAAGFSVHVVDDRAAYASPERFPGADLIVADIPAWLRASAIGPGAFVVVVTRGHRQDLEVMRELIGRPLRYLGLIGSRTKVAQVFDTLRGEAADPARLADSFSPIGLDIGAVTPAEIGVSVVAELVAVRTGRIAEPHVAAATLRAARRI
jgi:xanthine dehydrogenase accessory factor